MTLLTLKNPYTERIKGLKSLQFIIQSTCYCGELSPCVFSSLFSQIIRPIITFPICQKTLAFRWAPVWQERQRECESILCTIYHRVVTLAVRGGNQRTNAMPFCFFVSLSLFRSLNLSLSQCVRTVAGCSCSPCFLWV